MNYTIKNSNIKIQVSSLGAELQSIKSANGIEYLWQGDNKYWGRRSPVLFPIVGALKHGYYLYNGKKYHMNQHGFARDCEFTLIDETKNSLTFELRDNSETLKKYPFKFILRIRYKIEAKSLFVHYEVINSGDTNLLFSIGAHPAFNCPLEPDFKREDYTVEFEKTENTKSQILVDGLRGGVTKKVFVKNKTIPISKGLFDDDALILSNLNSSKISISKGNTNYLSLCFQGFPYLGIWSKSRVSPFVCLEPWYGIADSIGHNHNLDEKEGISSLKPSGIFETSFSITID